MGALAAHEGHLVEMATGEGKTLTLCLAAILEGWTGRPCHVITANDYLAERDAREMRPLYERCGLRVGQVTAGMTQDERRQNYSSDVVYTTSKELLADFLRDRLAMGNCQEFSRRWIRRLRRSGSPIVDEADSVLVDEAATPLIIAEQRENHPLIESSIASVCVARDLERDRDYEVDPATKRIQFTASGLAAIAAAGTTFGGLWRSRSRRVELVQRALAAREFHRRDQQYVIQDRKVVIVDEFTGRLMPDRTWQHGIHQAVEALEELEVQSPAVTLSRMSFQRFFRRFRRLSGFSGTAREAASELWGIYELPVVSVPTNRPCLREMLPDSIHLDRRYRLQAITEEVARLHRLGRPVLVGTRSVEASQVVADRLREAGLAFQLLNALSHQDEARIVALAGRTGQVTVATNMAGRGTDIKLEPGVAELGGLHVVAAERNESGRIDRQLFGRCARQGDPGSARAFVSPEDDLFRRFIPPAVCRVMELALRSGIPGSDMIASHAVRRAQSAAESLATRHRRQVLEMDTWFEENMGFASRGVQD
jgi:preprotein translocase subunit SecA